MPVACKITIISKIMTNFLFFLLSLHPSFLLPRSSGVQASDSARLPRKHHGGGGWSGQAGV